METITIKKSTFDNLFEQTLDKLKLKRFTSNEEDAKFVNSPIGSMHRSFHYEVCILKERIEKAE